MSETELFKFEEKYFNDDALFEEFLIVEEELIDDYVRARLSSTEKELFEKYFLTSSKKFQRVEFAKALITNSTQLLPNLPSDVKEKNSWLERLRNFFFPNSTSLKWSFGFTLTIFVIGMAWLINKNIQLEKRLNKIEEENIALQKEKKALLQQASIEGFDTNQLILNAQLLFLNSGLQRGESRTTLKLSKNDSYLELILSINTGSDHQKYKATLKTIEKTTVWEGEYYNTINTINNLVRCFIPTKLFSKGDYILTLTSLPQNENSEELDYSFRVDKNESK